jgi:hypothetical protein
MSEAAAADLPLGVPRLGTGSSPVMRFSAWAWIGGLPT